MPLPGIHSLCYLQLTSQSCFPRFAHHLRGVIHEHTERLTHAWESRMSRTDLVRRPTARRKKGKKIKRYLISPIQPGLKLTALCFGCTLRNDRVKKHSHLLPPNFTTSHILVSSPHRSSEGLAQFLLKKHLQPVNKNPQQQHPSSSRFH